MFRRSFYRGSLCGAALLVPALAWWALDPKGDARQHMLDRSVRLLDQLRDAVRL